MSLRGRIALSVLIISYWLANTMLRPLIAPYASDLGAESWQIGLVLAAHSLPAFVMAIPSGMMADTGGFRTVALRGGVLVVFGGAVLWSTPGYGELFASQALVGVGSLMVWLSIQGLMIGGPDEEESREGRNRRIANYSQLVIVGQLIGPVLGGVLVDEAGGFRTAFLVFGGLTALTLVAVIGLPRDARDAGGAPVAVVDAPDTVPDDGAEGALSGASRTTFRDVFGSFRQAAGMMRQPGMLVTLVVTFCALYLQDVRTAFQPLYLNDIGITAATVGLLLSIGSAAGLLSRVVLLPMLSRFRLGTVTAFCLIPGALATCGVVLVDQVAVLVLLSIVSGLTLGLAQPLTLTLTADFTRDDERGMGIALRLLANRAAQWVNPILFGALAVFGLGLAFGATAVLVVSAAIVASVALNRLRHR